MIYRNRFFLITSIVVLLVCSFDSVAQTTQTAQFRARLFGSPSNELTNDPVTGARFGMLCYEFFTGLLVDTCRVEFHLMDIGGFGITEECVPDVNGQITTFDCANGGHTHGPPDFPDDPRPRTFNNEPVLYPGDELTDPVKDQFDALGFSPLSQDVGFTWNLPQSSGIYEFNAKLTATPGSAFFWIPTIVKTFEYLGTVNVSQSRLGYRRFPSNDAAYAKVRNGRLGPTDPNGVGSDPDHTEAVAYSAAEITHRALPLIAAEYLKLRGRRLSINDISLPMGGVFDDKENWVFDHKEHRDGRDVDINTDSRLCRADMDLRTAVNKFLVKLSFTSKGARLPPSALLCESGGRKHIDMTWLVTGPVT